jgi:hypothetical protein
MRTGYKCDMTWDQLTGDGEIRRHCDVCNHQVVNLVGKTQAEAMAELNELGGQAMCARYVSRDGRVIHDGDPLEQLHDQQIGAREMIAAAVVVAIAVGVALSVDDIADFVSGLGKEEPSKSVVSMGVVF